MLEESGGELTPEIKDTINKLDIEEKSKLENIGLLIQSKKEESEMFKNQIDRLQKLKKQAENKQKSLKEYLSWYFNSTGINKYDAGLVKYSFRTSKQVNITDINALPNGCTTMEIKPDKKYIKDLLKLNSIPCAELVENKSLQVK